MNNSPTQSIGLLAIQGSVAEHAEILKQLNISFKYIRSKDDLEHLTHLILPGGESTTMTKLLKCFGMWEIIVKKVKNNQIKIFGTCAGAILCQQFGLEIKIERNGFGAQQNSFAAKLTSEKFSNLQGIFIRAPRFLSVGKNVEVLATWNNEPVLVQQDNLLAASFHPELCGEVRIHKHFLRVY
jgi:5'-phosphate synthase pdxT subunit